jgi:hypothetical protein
MRTRLDVAFIRRLSVLYYCLRPHPGHAVDQTVSFSVWRRGFFARGIDAEFVVNQVVL